MRVPSRSGQSGGNAGRRRTRQRADLWLLPGAQVQQIAVARLLCRGPHQIALARHGGEHADDARPARTLDGQSGGRGMDVPSGLAGAARILVRRPLREIGGPAAHHPLANPIFGRSADDAWRAGLRWHGPESALVQRQRAVRRAERDAVQRTSFFDERNPCVLPLGGGRRDARQLGQPLEFVDDEENRPIVAGAGQDRRRSGIDRMRRGVGIKRGERLRMEWGPELRRGVDILRPRRYQRPQRTGGRLVGNELALAGGRIPLLVVRHSRSPVGNDERQRHEGATARRHERQRLAHGNSRGQRETDQQVRHVNGHFVVDECREHERAADGEDQQSFRSAWIRRHARVPRPGDERSNGQRHDPRSNQ